MGMYVTQLLDFSRDPLSDTTPTWTDVSQYVLSIQKGEGITKEGETLSAGEAQFVLRNQDRRFEPDYAAGAYYPDIVDMRRFRLRIQNGVGSGTIYDEGIWYVKEWRPVWPDDAIENVCVVTCVDGSSVVALDDLPTLDPPTADTYADVVEFDEPWGYWRLGEPEGTKARANIVRGKKVWKKDGEKHRRKWKRRRGTRYSTRAEAGGTSGPAGTYRNTPGLGADGLILGDSDTAVAFRAAQFEWVRVPIEDNDLEGKAFTVEALVAPTAASTDGSILTGPVGPGGGPIWGLTQAASGNDWRVFVVVDSGPTVINASGGTPAAATPAHLAGTWNGQLLSLYVDGVLVASSDTPNTIGSIAASPAVQIGSGVGGVQPFDGTIDEAVIYEYALPATRVLAHYEAGAERGWPVQTAGARIADIFTHALWSETGVQTSGFDVQPAMKHGQPRLGDVEELAHSEGPRTMVYFNGTGGPEYRGWEWVASAAAYNTVQATFGNGGGEIPYESITLRTDNETFNEVVATHESGDPVTMSDATSQGQRGVRRNSEFTDILLTEHEDVEAVATQTLELYKDGAFGPETLTLSGANVDARAQIFTRLIGHRIRVKHRPNGGTPIDRVCNIIGRTLTLDEETGHLTCVWNLSRGFNGTPPEGGWMLGAAGFSELGTTTRLG